MRADSGWREFRTARWVMDPQRAIMGAAGREGCPVLPGVGEAGGR